MSLSRVFLGWNRPALDAAVDYLAGQSAAPDAFDFQGVVVAVSAARAGRRLLEILVQRAHAAGRMLVPPEIVTVGRLPELLYTAKRPFAGELVQQLAWVEALRRADPVQLAPLLPHPPEPDDLAGWLALGEMLGRLHRELAAEALDFKAVVDAGSRLQGFVEENRWAALLAVQRSYLEILDQLGLWDLQTARLFAIRQGECAIDRRILLVGTVDLNRAARMMLDQVEERVTALVFAPPELADRFDDHGCLDALAWQNVPIAIETDQIEVVDGPSDQAAAAVRAVCALDGQYSADEITIGVPDARIVPHLQQQFRQCDVAARYGVGASVARSAPYRFLAAVAEYLDQRRFSAFAALMRHPAVGEWLARTAPAIDGDWLSELDRYHADHLPLSVGGAWLGSPEHYALIRQVYERIEALLQDALADSHEDSSTPRHSERSEESGLARPFASLGVTGRGASAETARMVRSLGEWGAGIAGLLVAVFGGRPLDRSDPADRSVLAACEKIRGALALHEHVPGKLAPIVSAAAAIRLLLRALAGETIAPPADPGAIELLGWLELPWDDAPVLVVTGMNEGIVPASCNEDLFLPNQLRRELGLLDNDQRLARDVYSLALLAASRRRLRVIAGRRSPEGDPLVPSRLLFATDPATAARRALAFFRADEAAAAHVVSRGALRPGRARSTFEPPRPEPLDAPVRDMRVTEFREFLACPYRYYLRRRLGLEGLADDAEELDGGLFGTLAHEALGEFGRGDAASSTDPERIAAALDAALDEQVRRLFGRRPLAAILVQVEQIRARLHRFAHWQADRAAAGWRIERVEAGPEPERAQLLVDDEPMYLHGRIDRIDLHEATGRRTILDYKTSDSAQDPNKAHRTAAGEWIDLQLPLYRHLLAGMGIKGPVELGYILLPKDLGKIDLALAPWTEADLAEADAVAEDVIRRVRRGDFWPPTDVPPAFSEDFAAICHDGQFGDLDAAETDSDDEGDAP
ncbi:MAG: PD-(D/E)XK nuclease family protein [Pirellulales bacterium]|nr:PD-(D/E)XK nuclease family protein [Pirellulales bacterium]